MTTSDFLAYKYTLYNYASEISYALYNDAQVGKKTVDNDFIKLKALLVYIRIINEYDIDNDNMFTDEEMQIVINHINKICGSNYNIDLDIIDSEIDS